MATNNNLNGLPDDGTIEQLVARFEKCQEWENYRQTCTAELLKRYHYVTTELDQERKDREREQEWNRGAASREKALNEQLQYMKVQTQTNPFVLVLLDGDAMIFRPSFLQEGDAGGRRAAVTLRQAVDELLHVSVSNLPTDIRVLVRIYADVEGLAKACEKAKIVDRAAKVKAFARGFTQAAALCDFIDAGPGGYVKSKVEETIKLHLSDPRCYQVFLGCSNDRHYVRTMNELSTDEANFDRIRLLEGVAFEKQISLLPFQTFQLLTLFRNTKISGHGQTDQTDEPLSTIVTRSGTISGVLTPSSTPTLSSRSLSRQENIYPLARSNIGTPVPGTAAATTWAAISQKVAAQPLTTAPQLNKPDHISANGIRRNKKGQRIDPTPPEYKKDEVESLKKLKLCNAHFLRGDCPYPDNKCSHSHVHNLNKDELLSLKLVARMSPCIHGIGCDDPKCIYGHNCPFPQASVGTMRGKACIMADDCRFPPEMHAVDKKAVVMTKVV